MSFLVHRTITVAVPTGSVPGNTGIVPPHYRDAWSCRGCAAGFPLRVPDAPELDRPRRRSAGDRPAGGWSWVLRRLPDVVALGRCSTCRASTDADAVAADPASRCSTVQTLYRAHHPASCRRWSTPASCPVFSPNLHRPRARRHHRQCARADGARTRPRRPAPLVLLLHHPAGGRLLPAGRVQARPRPRGPARTDDVGRLRRLDGTAATSNALVVFAASSVVFGGPARRRRQRPGRQARGQPRLAGPSARRWRTVPAYPAGRTARLGGSRYRGARRCPDRPAGRAGALVSPRLVYLREA